MSLRRFFRYFCGSGSVNLIAPLQCFPLMETHGSFGSLQALMTCTPIPVNAFSGTPTARTCPSLEISSSSELRLTLPGWALMSASTDSTSSSSSSAVSPSTAVASPGAVPSPVRSVKTSASSRRGQPSARASRAATSATARSSAWCSAERMIVLTWAAVGGSIRAARICRSSSARTCSSRRSSCQITSTRCETDLARSVLVHSCQPGRPRNSLRCRFAAREVVEPQLRGGDVDLLGDVLDRIDGNCPGASGETGCGRCSTTPG
ncbi:hypothetical protein SHIRM173S_07388 [Streptomyces hirsutus]